MLSFLAIACSQKSKVRTTEFAVAWSSLEKTIMNARHLSKKFKSTSIKLDGEVNSRVIC